MGLMTGKKALIFGVANERSIAWGITKAFHKEGARIALSYAGEALKDRVTPLAGQVGCDFVEQCDVGKDDQIDALFAKAKSSLGTIDVLVHAIAFAKKEDLESQYVTTSRDGFRTALEVSAYSLVALANRARGLMPNGGSILTLTYYGAEKVIPHYNVMGVAKAALEASVRYLAYDLGRAKIRVNAISAGPIKTLAAAGVGGFRSMLDYCEKVAPLGRLVSTEDVGNCALSLCSDLGSAVTGEVLYVDAGFSTVGMPSLDNKPTA
jgi:enoyl-[acyl-carrier protein] reductase I